MKAPANYLIRQFLVISSFRNPNKTPAKTLTLNQQPKKCRERCKKLKTINADDKCLRNCGNQTEKRSYVISEIKEKEQTQVEQIVDSIVKYANNWVNWKTKCWWSWKGATVFATRPKTGLLWRKNYVETPQMKHHSFLIPKQNVCELLQRLQLNMGNNTISSSLLAN